MVASECHFLEIKSYKVVDTWLSGVSNENVRG